MRPYGNPQANYLSDNALRDHGRTRLAKDRLSAVPRLLVAEEGGEIHLQQRRRRALLVAGAPTRT
jgi:hypothetical protein